MKLASFAAIVRILGAAQVRFLVVGGILLAGCAAPSAPSAAYYEQIATTGPQFHEPTTRPRPLREVSIQEIIAYFDAHTDAVLELDPDIVCCNRQTRFSLDFGDVSIQRNFYTFLKAEEWHLVHTKGNVYRVTR